ncbi:hypothetical protein MAR_031764 [Mya arenaria]|uniref:Uncharacterized protein n=1 Tax=Mya arenaria TaxID=6604 RepID=A0ABY7F5P4_MYAAR|nr:hypothetical protein MAR_031764 [Mya arenaria]
MLLRLGGVILLAVLKVCYGGGNPFYSTSKPNPSSTPGRLLASAECVHHTTSDTYSVFFFVTEVDETKDSNGNRIAFKCDMVSRGKVDADMEVADLTNAELSTCSGEGPSFSRLRATVPGVSDPEWDKINHQTLYYIQTGITKIVDSGGSVNTDCGGRDDALANGEITHAAVCYLEADRNHEYDRFYKFQFDVDNCIKSDDATDADIMNPESINLWRAYQCTMPMIRLTEVIPDADEVNGPIPLGTPLVFEASITIADQGGQPLYFADGYSPLGMFLYDCQSRPLSTGNTIFRNGASEITDITDEDGCGLGNSPFLQWDDFTFQYAAGLTAKSYLEVPNSHRSKPVEAVSYARISIDEDLTTVVTCKCAYCRSIDDKRCFGNLGNGDSYTDQCPAPNRRRRQAANDTDTYWRPSFLPTTVSATYTITLNKQDPSAATVNGRDFEESQECFEQNTFITLSVVLASVLVIVMCIDAFLALKMRAHYPKDGSSNGSMSGFANKAFN